MSEPITVAELVEHLQRHDQTARVHIQDMTGAEVQFVAIQGMAGAHKLILRTEEFPTSEHALEEATGEGHSKGWKEATEMFSACAKEKIQETIDAIVENMEAPLED